MKRTLLAFIMFIIFLLPSTIIHAEEKTKFDTLLYLHCALTPDEYGGIYMKDGKYYVLAFPESNKKIEQVVAQVQKLHSSPKIMVYPDAKVSIRELALTKKILSKLPVNYKYEVYCNIPQNKVCVYSSYWTEDMMQEMMEFAGIDYVNCQQILDRDAISFGFNVIFRVSDNSIEWYQAGPYGNCENYIDARYMNSPIYEKNGEWMIPLRDFIFSFPGDKYFNWNESKKELEISIASNYYRILMNNANININGIDMDKENLFNGIEVRDGIVYVPAKMAYALIGHIGVFQKDILYNPEYKTISEAY